MSKSCSAVYPYILLIDWTIDGHVGCSLLLVIVGNVFNIHA